MNKNKQSKIKLRKRNAKSKLKKRNAKKQTKKLSSHLRSPPSNLKDVSVMIYLLHEVAVLGGSPNSFVILREVMALPRVLGRPVKFLEAGCWSVGGLSYGGSDRP